MNRPGILISFSGMQFAIRRFEDIETRKKIDMNDKLKNEADLIRAFTEIVMWFFIYNEDLEILLDKNGYNYNKNKIFSETLNKELKAMRFVRNRITHKCCYYWDFFDVNTCNWTENIIKLSMEEEKRNKYITDQYSCYKELFPGKKVSSTINSIVQHLNSLMAKFNLTNL